MDDTTVREVVILLVAARIAAGEEIAAAALTETLVTKGVFTADELTAAVAAVRRDEGKANAVQN